MRVSTRPLGPDDLADARRLGWEAFGVPADTAGTLRLGAEPTCVGGVVGAEGSGAHPARG